VSPTAEELADITLLVAKEVRNFNMEPRVAMLSYSNFGSSDTPEAKMVAEATRIVKQKNPSLIVDGEMQGMLAFNKEILKESNINVGENIVVELQPDVSKYGMPISEEMEEVLYNDPDGSILFHKLTPGAQRTLIHVINRFKSSNLKIERSFVILEHLKKTKGKIDFKLLKEDFKNQRNNMKF
jgi:hypothetical protein